MNHLSILSCYRQYKKLSLEMIAKELNLSTESYKELEEGKLKINAIHAKKLSDFYQAPIELFMLGEIGVTHHLRASVLYHNCTFIGGQGGSSGYVNHQYNDRGMEEIVLTKNEEIRELKQEIKRLQQKIK